MSGLNNPGHPTAGPDPLSTKTHEAPPQHPSLGSTTTRDTTGATGTTAGDGVADKVKAGWNVFHGTGEALRGNFNNVADRVGDQLAGRDESTTTQATTRTEGGQRPAQVAASGADELTAGLKGLQK